MSTDATGALRRARGRENFPVASILLPAHARRAAHGFYALARMGDDIADSPHLTPMEKETRLNTLQNLIHGIDPVPSIPQGDFEECASALRSLNLLQGALDDTEKGGGYVRDLLDTLLAAFLQDVRRDRRASWGDLVDYCRLSAVPVGRFLLFVTGGIKGRDISELEDRAPELRATDALSIALQILNHIQDMGTDYRRLDRVYVPQDWLVAYGASCEDLAGRRLTPALEHVKTRMLDAADSFLDAALGIGENYVSSRLAYEARGILAVARALSRRLRRADPLDRRVALPRPLLIAYFLWGGLRYRPFPFHRGKGS